MDIRRWNNARKKETVEQCIVANYIKPLIFIVKKNVSENEFITIGTEIKVTYKRQSKQLQLS